MKKALFIGIVVLIMLAAQTPVMNAEDAPSVAYQIGATASTYRQLGLDMFRDDAEKLKEQGEISEYSIYRNVTDGDVSEQISQIRDIIAMDYDVVVVNPNSDSALNGVYEEAVEAGMTVVVLAIPTHPDVWGLSGDNYGDFYDFANWVVEQTGGEGRAIHIYGIEGSPNNQLRMEGVYDAIEGTNIELIAEGSGGWDDGQAKEVASSFLASYDDIDIVFTHAMDQGILGAFQDANRAPKYTYAHISKPSFEILQEFWDRGQDVQFYAPKSHAGLPQSALHVGIKLHHGLEPTSDVIADLPQEISPFDNTIIVENPGPVVTNENFDEYWEIVQDKPDDWLWAFTVEPDEIDDWFNE